MPTTPCSALSLDDVQCLASVFNQVPDPRKTKGLRHPLGAMLSLVLTALLSGAENPQQISRFAQTHPHLLAALGFRPPKQGRLAHRRDRIAPPSNDTVARLCKLADAGALNNLLAAWLFRLSMTGDAAAIDGKALRGQDGFVLSIYSNRLKQVLWQEEVRDKQNELSTLERLLPLVLDKLKKARLFTGDAAFCHKTIARLIVENKREYLLQLKAPHQTDLRQAKDAFSQRTRRKPAAQTAEKRGGREGRRS